MLTRRASSGTLLLLVRSLKTLVPVVPRFRIGEKGKAVQIGRGPATVIGEPNPREAQRPPLIRQLTEWEGGG